ncbi:MAG: Mth938-like domain-containing protein [Pseudomonadota bacterium]
MRITEIVYETGQPVDGYGPGFFRLGDAVHHGPLAVLPGGVLSWAGWPDCGVFTERAGDIDVLLAGMGAEIAPVPEAAARALEAAGIGVEPMSSPSACRTYNILLAEGRRVGLAALPI